MMFGEISLENGDRYEFVLTGLEVRKLEQQVQRQNEYLRRNGKPETWNMACEMRFAVDKTLALMLDPEEKGTPAAGTAGEPR